MDKKRENVLFPLGFNSLPVTAIAYNMRFKEEVDQKLADMKLQLESDFNNKLEKMRKDLQTDFNNKLEKMRKDLQTELRKEILEEMRRQDSGWEKVDNVEEREK